MPTALVLGTSFRSGPVTCRSLRRMGVDVVGAEEPGLLAGRSRDLWRPLRCPSAATGPEAFAGWVADTCARVRPDAVLTTDEDMARAVALCEPDLGGAVLLGAGRRQYEALCDKARLHATADAVGVVRADAVVVAPGAGAPARWPALPSIVKPVVSGEAALLSAVRVDDAAARGRAVSVLNAAGCHALVEEWIEGPQLSVYAVRDGLGRTETLAARVLERVPRIAGTPSVFVTVESPAAHAATVRLLDAVDHRGPANTQFIEREGELVVHDVNLRVAAAVGMMVHAGFDVPARAMADALGRPVPALRARAGVRYVAVWDEVGTAWRELRDGHAGEAARIARALAAAARSGACIDPRLSDPVPYAAAVHTGARRAARRITRRS